MLPGETVRVLMVGSGVIGTVYGAHLACAGHPVSVVRHPPRTEEVARSGLTAHDVLSGTRAEATVSVVPDVGLPRNLALLHNPILKPVAARYWARTMRSPIGELAFAAHSRHAPAEIHALGNQVIARLAASPGISHLRQLLDAPAGRQHQ